MMGEFILPDSAIALIHQASEDEQRPQFAIGDIAAELIDEFGKYYPKHVIRRKIAIEYRCGPETIRDREGVSRKVPVDLREQYEALSFHQWKALSAAKSREEMCRLADWAVRSADEFGGRPAPVSAIRRRMRNGLSQQPVWVTRWEKVLELLEMLAIDEKCDPDIKKFCQEALSIVKKRELD